MPEINSKDTNNSNDPFWTDEGIRYWQMRIDSAIVELNDDNDRIFEHYVVNSDSFQTAVLEVRKKLKIQPIKKFNIIFDLEKWSRENLALDDNSNFSSHAIYFLDSITKISDSIGLPRAWRDTFAHYVVTDTKPEYSYISSKRKIARIKDVDDESITIRFSKGIRQDEYLQIWSKITEHLGAKKRQTKLPDKDIRARDIQMYMKRKSGMKYSDIAKLYLSTDKEYAIDTVKKAVKRQSDLFEKGIYLAD